MYFTQEDYKKIENWLHRNSVKDTEFQEALPFTGKEIVTVVQDGHNRKVNIQEFINQLYKHGVEDFLNVTNTYRANNITLKEAIRLIPAEARKEGQVITFLNTDGNWEIYQFIGKLNQWNNPTLWNNPFDWEKLIIDSILPDEEDLTKSAPDAKGNAYLSLKDRKYEPDKYSGLGRKILRRRVVEIEDPIYGTQKKNMLLQADFSEENTIYEIRYNFDLNDAKIIIPRNSILEFKGGSIENCTLVLQKTIIHADNIKIFNNVILEGDLANNDIVVEWFGCSVDTSPDDNRLILKENIIPSAINCRANIYHSAIGKYKMRGAYPVGGEYLGYENGEHIYGYKDFKGITIYGTGENTVIYGVSVNGKNPGDVFNMVNTSNLTIKNLAVSAETVVYDDYGTNAFSLVHYAENITIENCFVYDMPYNNLDGYPDGGKGFTIQGTKGSVKNIIIKDNRAVNVSFGIDCTKTKYKEGDTIEGVRFINNSINNAVCGCYIGLQAISSEIPEFNTPLTTVSICNNSFINCQYGVYGNLINDTIITENTIVNNTRWVNESYYSNKVESILLYAAKRCIISNNSITALSGDVEYMLHLAPISNSVVSVFPYSYTSNNVITGNTLRGTVLNTCISVGSDKPEYYYFAKNNNISNNIVDIEGANILSNWMLSSKFLTDNLVIFNIESLKEQLEKNYKYDYNILERDTFKGGSNNGEWILSKAASIDSQNRLIINGTGENYMYFNIDEGIYKIQVDIDSISEGRVQFWFYDSSGNINTLETISDVNNSTVEYIISNKAAGLRRFSINAIDSTSKAVLTKYKLKRLGVNAESIGVENLYLSDIKEDSPKKYQITHNIYGTLQTKTESTIAEFGVTSIQKLPDVPAKYAGLVRPEIDLGVCFWNGSYWCDYQGYRIVDNHRNYGTTEQRNAMSLDYGHIGFTFFDTTIGRPVWWVGSSWVDATGANV